MEDVVPLVPYLFDNNVDIMSPNVTNYSFDQFAGTRGVRSVGRSAATSVGRGVARQSEGAARAASSSTRR